MNPIAQRLLAPIAALTAVALLSSCGTTDITRARVENALTPTFANLYVQQAVILGHTGVTIASTAASASCFVSLGSM